MDESGELLSTLRSLADYADRNFCRHEETHRGGVLWEICDQCGAKWADDEGGMPEDARELPDAIKNAYMLLDKHRGEKNMNSITDWVRSLSEDVKRRVYELSRERMVAMRDENKYLTLEDALEWVRENETWGDL